MRSRRAGSGNLPAMAPMFSPHVVDARGGRDRAGNRRVRDHELEEELGPVGAVDLRRPGRQRLAGSTAWNRQAAVERPVDQHRHAAFGRERQEPPLGLAVGDAVAELDRVQRPARPSRPRSPRDAGRARWSCRRRRTRPACLVRQQRLEMPLPGQHVVDLHEVEPLDAPAARASASSAPDPAWRAGSRPWWPRTAAARRAAPAPSRSPPPRSRTSARSRSRVPAACEEGPQHLRPLRRGAPRRSPTLNVIHVPMPTAGNSSPVKRNRPQEWLGRIRRPRPT